MAKNKKLEEEGLIEGIEGKKPGKKLEDTLKGAEMTGRIERELKEFKTGVDDVLDEADQMAREKDWEKMIEDEKYGQYLEKNPQMKEYMMGMNQEEYERMSKDLKFYLYNKSPEELQGIFADPKRLEHHLELLDSKYHDQKLADLYQYGVNPENKEQLKDFMQKNPALFERSFNGLPEGESWETIGKKIEAAGFDENEKQRLINYISDFRNYEYSTDVRSREKSKQAREKGLTAGAKGRIDSLRGHVRGTGDDIVEPPRPADVVIEKEEWKFPEPHWEDK